MGAEIVRAPAHEASEAKIAAARVVVGAATQGPATMLLGLNDALFADAGEARGGVSRAERCPWPRSASIAQWRAIAWSHGSAGREGS